MCIVYILIMESIDKPVHEGIISIPAEIEIAELKRARRGENS
jgi:hypothetical protein